jgi:hypothetical protein
MKGGMHKSSSTITKDYGREIMSGKVNNSRRHIKKNTKKTNKKMN